jgi:hypothetical protein
MKQKQSDWDREKKIHRVEKGSSKMDKHRNRIYNLISRPDDYDDDLEDEIYSEVYDDSKTKHKQR